MVDHTHTEFGIIGEKLSNIESKQDRTLSTIDKIFDRIEGKNGITSEIAVLKAQNRFMPSVKTLVFYSSVGGGLTVAGFLLLRHLLGTP